MQRTLFDGGAECERLSRSTIAAMHRATDPETSQIAAGETQQNLPRLVQATYAKTSFYSARTANEIAELACKDFGGVQETYRKRILDLKRAGLIRECEKQRCAVTGRLAMTFIRTSEG